MSSSLLLAAGWALLVGLLAGALVGWRAGRSASGAGQQAFAQLSAQALADNRAGFLAQAEGSLQRLEAQLHAVESSRQEAYGGLRSQLAGMREAHEELRRQTAALVTALRAPQVRGRWGEMQLRRVVEAAGALEHVHFAEQVASQLDGVGRRPDLVVDLSEGKQIAVDAKVPFAAWLEAMEATDEAQRQLRLTAHARALREHVKALSEKGYWRALAASPEIVVLFVPADAFLDTALAQDPTLLDDAFARGVVLATPATLVALLRTVAFCWRSQALAENTAQVAQLGRELYDRLGTLGGRLDQLGAALTRSVSAYNETIGTLERRVLVTARKFAGAQRLAPPAAPTGLDQAVRPLAAAELLDEQAS